MDGVDCAHQVAGGVVDSFCQKCFVEMSMWFGKGGKHKLSSYINIGCINNLCGIMRGRFVNQPIANMYIDTRAIR